MMATMSLTPTDLIDIELMAMEIIKERGGLGWREWVGRFFGAFATSPFAQHHVEMWEWGSAIVKGVPPRPFIACWPRGGAKSTTVELLCAYLGSQPDPVRHFVLYVSETQAQADRHVATIAGMLEKVGISRALNEYGASKGWKHAELRGANGFNVTAMGLDSAMRGAKLDEFRPDLIVFDDIDGRHDTERTVAKKIDTITTSIMPTGSTDAAIIVVQNMIHEHGIMAQLIDGTADFLHDRLPTEPIPAVRDLEWEQVIQADGTPRYVITGGTPSWEGQTLAICESQMTKWGVRAFLREAQHDVEDVEGGLWDKARDIDPFRVGFADVPDLDVTIVAIDPNVDEGGDAAGIIVAGVSHFWNDHWWDHSHGYVLADRTVNLGPKAWIEEAVATAQEFGADHIVAEVNNGGELVVISLSTAEGADQFPVYTVHASKGKVPRATPVQKLYEDGRVHHQGTFRELEKQLCGWSPKKGQRSPDRLDALVWAITDLMLDAEGRMHEPTGSLKQYLARQ